MASVSWMKALLLILSKKNISTLTACHVFVQLNQKNNHIGLRWRHFMMIHIDCVWWWHLLAMAIKEGANWRWMKIKKCCYFKPNHNVFLNLTKQLAYNKWCTGSWYTAAVCCCGTSDKCHNVGIIFLFSHLGMMVCLFELLRQLFFKFIQLYSIPMKISNSLW